MVGYEEGLRKEIGSNTLGFFNMLYHLPYSFNISQLQQQGGSQPLQLMFVTLHHVGQMQYV